MNTETLVILKENKECPWSNANEYSWYTKHPVIKRVGFTYTLDSLFEGSYIKSYSEQYGEESGYIPNPVLKKINCIYQETNQMTFNQEKYVELLSLYTPKPIETEEEYTFYMIVFEKIFNEEKSKENDAFIILLALLIEEYENKHYPIPELTLVEFLEGMIDNLELTFNDLVSVIDNKELTQQILEGTYEIDKPIAKVLGEYFSVDYRSFL